MGRSGYRPRGFRLLRIRAALTAENAEVALQLYDEMSILLGLAVIYVDSRYIAILPLSPYVYVLTAKSCCSLNLLFRPKQRL